ncbi:DUF4405 domain-containing protein [Desulfoferrobacter suflitae]|uniref:DUF4405 domain-containing protein n=1 Tax=Desulfoferrobacter suflitae TaxID=2865782 RepID=UPI0021640569|nr:DUF4405 domain-containing protein [Desulfoferrobacter suflitae]MCK8603725.1 DUF4405 domain-containing protein [Desulfoferrobacter suflitae]
MSIREITSLTMLISFVLCVLTSVVLYITPHGRIAYWTDWRLWGLSKTQWSDLHLNLGILLLLAGLLHVYYNWKPITAYLKNKAKEMRVFTVNFNVALVLTLIVGVGTYYSIPPMSTIVELGESIKASAGIKYGEPPYGRAELSSLKMFTQKVDLDLPTSIELLRKAGIKFDNETQTLAEIAKKNDLSTKQLYEIIKPAVRKEQSLGSPGMPDSPPPGFGRKRLAEVCADFGLELPEILDVLSGKGVQADAVESIKEIAAKNNMEPKAIFEIIKDLSKGPSSG